jgi:hypothetical protein
MLFHHDDTGPARGEEERDAGLGYSILAQPRDNPARL